MYTCTAALVGVAEMKKKMTRTTMMPGQAHLSARSAACTLVLAATIVIVPL